MERPRWLWIRNGKIGVTVGGRDMKVAKKDFEAMPAWARNQPAATNVISDGSPRSPWR